MELKITIEPLIEYFTHEITPTQLARLLDILAYDYLKMMVRLQMLQDELIDIHEEADSYIFHLKEFQKVLQKCEA